MRCIIIEDQPPAQRVLKKYIHDVEWLELVGTFNDATSALSFIGQNHVALIFLDIHLPRMSGIEFLKSLSTSPYVILTTAFADYALESYEYNVSDYLLKPFSFPRFVQAVTKVQKLSAATESSPSVNTEGHLTDEIFVKTGHEHIKIHVSDILYIKSDADYTELYVDNAKYLSVEPLRHWLTLLDARRFTQIHKSYIVNVAAIAKVAGGKVYFNDQVCIPVGRAYKEHFMKNFVKG
ncbi:MAG: LytTR family DNA-binding domain-containing protein [Cyclobacteriaceae bacterium]